MDGDGNVKKGLLNIGCAQAILAEYTTLRNSVFSGKTDPLRLIVNISI